MFHATGTSVEQLDRSLRIFIADDHPLIRRLVRSTLQVQPHFEICGEAKNDVEAINKAKKLKQDIVVLSIAIPVLNGL
jgi:two-component system, NarL family, nitrate/nitrite response regulator NarL